MSSLDGVESLEVVSETRDRFREGPGPITKFERAVLEP